MRGKASMNPFIDIKTIVVAEASGNQQAWKMAGKSIVVTWSHFILRAKLQKINDLSQSKLTNS